MGIAEVLGWPAAHGMLYWNTEPNDNPHYVKLLGLWEGLTGARLCTSTARVGEKLAPGPDRLLRQGAQSGALATDLRDVKSTMQQTDAEDLRSSVPSGREKMLQRLAGIKDLRDFESPPEGFEPPQGSVTCVSGLLVNMVVSRTLKLISPCYPTMEYRYGYRIFDETNFGRRTGGLQGGSEAHHWAQHGDPALSGDADAMARRPEGGAAGGRLHPAVAGRAARFPPGRAASVTGIGRGRSMARKRKTKYGQRGLERLSSPNQLDRTLAVTSARGWIALLALPRGRGGGRGVVRRRGGRDLRRRQVRRDRSDPELPEDGEGVVEGGVEQGAGVHRLAGRRAQHHEGGDREGDGGMFVGLAQAHGGIAVHREPGEQGGVLEQEPDEQLGDGPARLVIGETGTREAHPEQPHEAFMRQRATRGGAADERKAALAKRAFEIPGHIETQTREGRQHRPSSVRGTPATEAKAIGMGKSAFRGGHPAREAPIARAMREARRAAARASPPPRKTSGSARRARRPSVT